MESHLRLETASISRRRSFAIYYMTARGFTDALRAKSETRNDDWNPPPRWGEMFIETHNLNDEAPFLSVMLTFRPDGAGGYGKPATINITSLQD